MAPKTPQGTSKSPKAPGAGGPIPLTGIPAPGSALQRRSFMPTPSSSALGAKNFQNMTPEQQSLLAEAISIHSPGLIDPNRKRAESVGSVTSDSAVGSGAYRQSSASPYQQNQQTPPPEALSSATGVLASPLPYRSPQARRTSTSRPGGSPENSPFRQSSNVRAANAAYSAIPPLTTASSQQSFASATSSPTVESPSGPRPLRLSTGPTSAVVGPSGLVLASTTRSSVKQPMFQRPPSAGGTFSGNGLRPAGGLPPSQGSNVLGSPVQQQNQLPASLEGIELGDRVVVESMGLSGYLRFVGPAEFKTGIWAGIELDTPTGKNDGSVNGVMYFNCRPKCGIFVLAAKIVKTELLIPFISTPADSAHPPSIQEDTRSTPPPPPTNSSNHAAQVVTRITAGSRASKYIGVTASQLKQRNGMPQSSNSRLSQTSNQNDHHFPATVEGGAEGSPTTTRTIAMGYSNSQTTSPTPTSTIAPRAGLGSRLSQQGSKTLLSHANRASASTATLARTGSTTISPSSTLTSRPRSSPTPGRHLTSPRRLSSRSSDHSDAGANGSSHVISNNINGHSGNNNTPSVLSSNLLDQATLVQMAQSPQDTLAVQLQQLQLDLGVAVAENNMLKTEMNQTKTQLEMNRLLEKRESLSYEERAFLSKSLGRGGIDEKLSRELEELHTMKVEWEKEKAAKDQEIQGITEKMTQSWLDAARSQKERTALMKERDELTEKIKELQEYGATAAGSQEQNEEQQATIDSLKRDLEEAEEKILSMQLTNQDLNDKAIEDEARVVTLEEMLRATQADYAEQLTLLERERDDLQARLDDLELVLKVTTEALQSKLEAALRDAVHSEELLHEVQARLDHESELRRTKESEAEARFKDKEAELLESQALLHKCEKLTKTLEEKAKEYESSMVKREQEIADLKLELEDLAGMVQSEEVDRMRKVWENEKKRLEEAVAEDINVITGLRTEIQTLELNETELEIKIEELEVAVANMKASTVHLESEVSRLQSESSAAQEQFEKERADLLDKVTESEKAIELHEAETKAKIEKLEAISQDVEVWKDQCEAMQLEMVQKTAKAEDVHFELVETQTQRDLFKQEAQTMRKELEDKASQLADIAKIQQEQMVTEEEKVQLLQKVSELEAAMALSASAPPTSTLVDDPGSGTEDTTNAKQAELEEEVAHLKQMVHDLTRENVTVASVNKKLMQEHDNLMEAHKHVETECLKLMDEVERLHAESLAAASMVGDVNITAASSFPETRATDSTENVDQLKLDKEGAAELQALISTTQQSQSVIRLEGLLKEKQALLDRLTQAHASEMRELRQRYVDLDRSKAYEVAQLNKELTELESLIESKIFHEADLEEDVQRKQKHIERLQYEVSDLKSQLSHSTMAINGLNGGGAYGGGRSTQPVSGSSLRGEYRTSTAVAAPTSVSATPLQRSGSASSVSKMSKSDRTTNNNSKSDTLFCEICEVEGHDIINCTAVFGATPHNGSPSSVARDNKPAAAPPVSQSSYANTPVPTEMDDERPYCENCEEFGLHYTDECPNESLTY